MYVLSFDCGIANFAFSCIEFKNLININKNSIISFFDNNNYNIIKIDNVNIYKDELTSARRKTSKKKTFDLIDTPKKCKNKNISSFPNLHKHVIDLLYNIVKLLDINTDLYILIEYQMNINYKANIIYNIIISFFETYFKIFNKKNFNIITINPSFKIKISQDIDVDDKIRIKYINQYLYNKKIVETYFLFLNKKYNFIDLNKYTKVDDIADSFIQILSYIFYYKK